MFDVPERGWEGGEEHVAEQWQSESSVDVCPCVHKKLASCAAAKECFRQKKALGSPEDVRCQRTPPPCMLCDVRVAEGLSLHCTGMCDLRRRMTLDYP